VVRIRARLHVRRFIREIADNFLRRAACSNLFFEIREHLNEEQRCDVGPKEIVQPHGLFRIQAFQSRLSKIRIGPWLI